MSYIDKLNKSIETVIDQNVDDGGKQMINLYVKARAFLSNLLSAYRMKNGDTELPDEIMRLKENVDLLQRKICELDETKKRTI